MTTLRKTVTRTVPWRGASNRALVISIEPLAGGDSLIRLREKGRRGGEVRINAQGLYARLVVEQS
jgi:hypothetical protein